MRNGRSCPLSRTASLVCLLGLAAVPTPVLGQGSSGSIPAAQVRNEIQRLVQAYLFREAEPLARAMLGQAEARSGGSSLETADTLDSLLDVLLLKKEGKDPEVEQLARRAVAIRESLQGPDHPDLPRSLHNLGTALFNAGRAQAAREVHERALGIREKALGPSVLDVAESIDHYVKTVSCWFSDSAGAKALRSQMLEIAHRAIEIKEAHLGPGHPALATSLHNLGYLLDSSNDLEGARNAHERALSIRASALPPNHPALAESLQWVGSLLGTVGDEPKGNAMYEKALGILEQSLGPEHPDIARNLDDLAVGYAVVGRYTESQEFHERALFIREKTLGQEHAEYAWNLNNLARLFHLIGDYARAGPLYEQALAIAERVLGREHRYANAIKFRYALLLTDTGDHVRAIELCREAIATFQAIEGPNHYTVGIALSGLARLFLLSGDPESARPLLERALAIADEMAGTDHFGIIYILSYLCSAESVTGGKNAQRTCERAINVIEKSFGPFSSELPPCLDALATLAAGSGDHAHALELLQRSLSIHESLGVHSPQKAATLLQLGDLQWRLGDARSALEVALRAEQIAHEHLRLTARVLPERQALRYAVSRPSGLSLAFSVALQRRDAQDLGSIWEALIRTRGLVLDEIGARHRFAAGSDDPVIDRLWHELAQARSRLANLTLRGPGEQPLQTFRTLLEDTARRKEDVEKALAEKSLEFRRDRLRGSIGLRDVAAALPQDTAIVAFWRFGRHALPGGRQEPGRVLVPGYVAFILAPGAHHPTLVDLGPASALEPLIKTWRREVMKPPRGSPASRARAESRYREAAEWLRRGIWDPIVPSIKGAARVLVVPDGMINLVSLAALSGRDGRYLVESPPMFHYLSAERDVVGEGVRESGRDGILVVAAPDFDAEVRSGIDEGLPVPPGAADPSLSAPSRTSSSYRSPRANCEELNALRLDPLPGARAEADQIARQFLPAGSDQGKPGIRILSLTGEQAQESAFKRLASGWSVLHLATHGFVFNDQCRSALEASRDLAEPAPAPRLRGVPPAADNPLLLTGLALAGANRRGLLPPDSEMDDGILTAEEIASLDLSGVDWAVLSACDTGLGDVQAGEGVLGLRRAFQVAGAQTLIMSLWPVQDDSTREWMGALYRGRREGKTTAEAVRSASLEMLSKRRAEEKSTHPSYWGAFVAAGDSR